MRRAVLSAVRQMTSSRQSPRMSPESAGVAFVELFDATPAGESSVEVVRVVQFHFEMVVPSSNSRRRSASHQTAKFFGEGAEVLICTPVALQSPPRELYISEPR